MKNKILEFLAVAMCVVTLVATSTYAFVEIAKNKAETKTETEQTEITTEAETEESVEEHVDLKAIETEIYDRLFESFSEVEGWEVTRDCNRIHISVVEE